MDQKITVLLVDDEPGILDALQRLLRRRGFDVVVASNGHAALEVLETTSADVIVSDFKMPGMNGGELLATVATRWPDMRRVLLSGCTEPIVHVDAVFIPKPYDQAHLVGLCGQGRLR